MEVLNGKIPDRVPVCPIITRGVAKTYGVKFKELAKNGELLGKAYLHTQQLYGFDIVWLYSNSHIEAEAMGTQLVYPEDDSPWIRQSGEAVKEPKDVEKLKVCNPEKDGHLHTYLEAIRYIRENIHNEVMILGHLIGPFSVSCSLRGLESLMTDTITNPDLVHNLCRIALENAKIFAKAQADAGADILWIGDAHSSPNLLSPEAHAVFAHPYQKELVTHIKKDLGLPVILHICGNQTLIQEQMVETGADVISMDFGVNLKESRERIANRAVVFGNIDPVSVMWRGTPGDVVRACREAIEVVGNDQRYILSSGDEIPPDTPSENIIAMVNSANIYGRYSDR